MATRARRTIDVSTIKEKLHEINSWVALDTQEILEAEDCESLLAILEPRSQRVRRLLRDIEDLVAR